METNHDGEIDHPCSDHGVARPAGVSRASGAPVRTNIRRDSDRRAAIDPAVPAILVTIDHPATRGLPAAFNAEGVPGVPVTTDLPEVIDLREAIGIPAVQGARVTIGLQAPIGLQGVIGPRAAQDALAEIGHPAVLDLRAAAIRRLDLDNLGVPANIGRSCPR
jgi:hypothetical protein